MKATTLAALLLAAALGLAFVSEAVAVEGYDPMRQISRELGHPNLMLVFDTSGSLGMRIGKTEQDDYSGDGRGNSFEYYAFENAYSDRTLSLGGQSVTMSRNHFARVGSDFTVSPDGTHGTASSGLYSCNTSEAECRSFPAGGAGQGYWIKAGTFPEGFEPAGSSFEGAVRAAASGTTSLYVKDNPGWVAGDIIRVEGFRNCPNNGFYRLSSAPVSANWGTYRSFRARKMVSGPSFGAADFSIRGEVNSDRCVTNGDCRRLTMTKVSLSAGNRDVFHFVDASRMALLKNVLGSDLTIDEVLPSVAASGTDLCGKPIYAFPPGQGPIAGAYYDWPSKRWMSWSDTTAAPAGDPAYTVRTEPGRFLATSSESVNWSLTAFSSTGSSSGCTTSSSQTTDTCPSCVQTAEVRVRTDPDDAAQAAIAARLAYFMGPVYSPRASGPASQTDRRCNPDPARRSECGLQSGGGTNTRQGLFKAIDTADAGSLLSVAATDDQRTCRAYGVVLVTDGQSNLCNAEPVVGGDGDPGNNSWDDCPAREHLYPAGRASQIWEAVIPGTTIPLRGRTFAVGVSDDVGRCELNRTAYQGRTDATSPNRDGGFDTGADPCLPPNAYLPNQPCPDAAGVEHAHGDYAYFANNVEDFRKAMDAVVAALGAGDYTTSPPAVAGSSDTSLAFVTSAAFPGWKGHLYAYDVRAQCDDTDRWDCLKPCGWVETGAGGAIVKRSNCLWDAGQVLADGNAGSGRAIYTWNVETLDAATGGYALVPIRNDLATRTALRTLLISTSGCTLASWRNLSCPVAALIDTGGDDPDGDNDFVEDEELAALVDYILGNDGGGVRRSWPLGALVSTTPAVIGPPELWKQGALIDHGTFEARYGSRKRLVYAGGSDGMVHAFSANDGHEVMAILPPDLLVKQAQYFNRYRQAPEDYPTGQAKAPGGHVYGVASSMRFADVYVGPAPSGSDPTPPPDRYKTILFLTEGPGGEGLHALDVTHPSAADPNHVTAAPFVPLWSRHGGTTLGATRQLAGLGLSWSIPALAAHFAGSSTANPGDEDAWTLLLGSGAVAGTPRTFRLNPASGALRGAHTFSPLAGYVANQAFADDVLWTTTVESYRPDNIVDEGLQADLHGRIWRITPDGTATQHIAVGEKQPLYYSPAVSTHLTSAMPWQAINYYAFASGTFFERDPDITGVSVGRSGAFIPTLYITSRPVEMKRSGNRDVYEYGTPRVQGVEIRTIRVEKDDGTLGELLGIRSQVTANTFLLTPKLGSVELARALFLIYDPDGPDCGTSYIVQLKFRTAPSGAVEVTDARAYTVGSGTMGGFALVQDPGTGGFKVIASRSYRGSGGRAEIVVVPKLTIPGGGAQQPINFWRELL